jgi:hypothetical protein
MRTSEKIASRVARRLRRRGLHIALLTIGLVALQASQCSKDDFYDPLFGGLDPSTGDIVGRVTVDGEPRSGVTVTVRQGTTTIDTAVTDGNGEYEFLELDPASYTVSISEITGADCPGEQTAVVVADDETERNFACTTPEPETGTVTGTVTLNGVPLPNLTVTLLDGTTVIATRPTDLNGVYIFQDVATGAVTVSIATPEGADCPEDQTVNVEANGTAMANFACTQQAGGFTPIFLSLVTDHRGNTSVICWILGTDPAQSGASFQVATTGPGVLTPTVSGTLNANGQSAVEVGINLFGTYGIVQTVTSGANQESASTTHTVDPTEGTCPVAQSSSRFKRDVTALLPDDARPLGLRPVAFRYREPWGDPAEPQIGLIAEEVAEVYPEAVYLDGRGRPDAIDYPALTRSVVEEIEGRMAVEVRGFIARLAF